MRKLTKIISIILATILVITAIPFTTFAAQKGDVDGKNGISATDARLILQVVAGLKAQADLKNSDAADLNGDKKITATDARIILQIVAGLKDAPEASDLPTEFTKATLVKYLNEQTAKASKGTYKWNRECEFSKNIDVGSATNTLNSIIKSIDQNASLNSVVGGFLGVGNAKGTQVDAGMYALISMKLMESDIKSFKYDGKEIEVVLKDSKNPVRGGNTAFNHVSNDFVTETEVKTAIAEITTAITVNSCTFNYKNVKLEAVLDAKGAITSLDISYTLDATMSLKAMVNINGTGAVETKTEYTNIKY